MSVKGSMKASVVVFVFLTVFFIQEAKCQQCEFPFQSIGSGCYYFSFPGTANFIQAQEYCEQIGATLAVLNTQEKLDAISNVVNDYSNAVFFIGGYRQGQGRNFIWNGLGTPVNQSNWALGNPPPQDGCMCLQPNLGGMWLLGYCSLPYNFICEKVNNTCYDSAVETTCDVGYTLVNGKCYSFETRRSLTWIKAKEYCERRGSVLGILDTEESNSGVTSIVSENYKSHNFWIGAYDQSHEGTWVWDGKGTQLSYSNWYTNQPNGDTTQNCTLVANNTRNAWEDASCDNPSNFICQQLPKTCGVTSIPDICAKRESTTPKPTSCDSPFALYGDACFYIQETGSETYYSWFEAVGVCRSMGATIGYILNQDEQDALTQYVKTQNYSPSAVCGYWIGLNDFQDETVWRWEGLGEVANYTYWTYGYPTYGEIANKCLYMNSGCSDGAWSNLSHKCTERTFRLICRK